MSMARVSKNIAFTVPPSMADEFERLAREEQSTKSELFRRIFRFYQASRKARRPLDEDFDAWVERAIFEAVEEKQTKPMSAEEIRALDEKLIRYGAERAEAAGIDVEDEEEINRLIHAERQKQRAKAPSRA
jgi:metal-responsive CopG/Arc/MetJ family transcriptional regulator